MLSYFAMDMSLEDLVQKDVDAAIGYLGNKFTNTWKGRRRVAEQIANHLIAHFRAMSDKLLLLLHKPGNNTEFSSLLLPQFAKAIIFLGGPERRR